MKKTSLNSNPMEIIFDIFIFLGIFVALGMSLIIALQLLNRNEEIMEIGIKLLSFS